MGSLPLSQVCALERSRKRLPEAQRRGAGVGAGGVRGADEAKLAHRENDNSYYDQREESDHQQDRQSAQADDEQDLFCLFCHMSLSGAKSALLWPKNKWRGSDRLRQWRERSL